MAKLSPGPLNAQSPPAPHPRPADKKPRPDIPHHLRLAVESLLLLAAFAFFCLHAVHLTADFPNFSPWKDWSKYTDEGWYGDAAIRHFQLGHWYLPGDFNPGAALPVWPLLEAAVFAFTGVSLTAARALTVAVFGGICLVSWLLLHRLRSPYPRSLAPSAAILLLTVSPFVFVFTRMAILEPLLILLTLLCLLAASTARLPAPEASTLPASQARLFRHTLRANLLPTLALGLLLPTLILTKTTGLFLLPAIAFLLLASLDYRLAPFFRVALPAALLALALWFGYYLLLVHNHLLLDYRYLFSANAYTGITRENFFSVLAETVTDGMWMGQLLYPTALAAAVVALFAGLIRPRLLRTRPLIPALLLWIGGYTFFLAYHDNLQPRYYLVIAVPLTLLLPVVIEQLVLPASRRPFIRRALLALAALGLCAIALPDARQTLAYTRHPQYTLLRAAQALSQYIAHDRQADPGHNPLVLSISGSDLSLITGLPSICDDFGTLELPDRVKKYRPGWYAAWNDVEDDKMEAMAPLFRLVRVAQFPAMDDPERNLLILYKLIPADNPADTSDEDVSDEDDPTDSSPKPHAGAHTTQRPTPKPLRTRVGQQPSLQQLEH